MLLGQVDCEFVQDLTRVTRKRSKEGAISIHDNEAIPAAASRFGEAITVTKQPDACPSVLADKASRHSCLLQRRVELHEMDGTA